MSEALWFFAGVLIGWAITTIPLWLRIRKLEKECYCVGTWNCPNHKRGEAE